MKKEDYTILYIDDDPYLREKYQSFFRQSGINMVTFINPAGDIAGRVLDVNPHLILLDISMPERNGFDALKILREDKRTKNIPVFFFSNLSSKGNIKKGINLGAQDYIVKALCEPEDILDICLRYLFDPKNYQTKYQEFI